MKKLITICAVVTAFVCISPTLVLATTVDTNFTTGTGASTQWNTTTFAVGMSSLELHWPLSVGDNRAGVLISDFGDPLVKDFDSWSYWGKNDLNPWPQFPAFTICIDTGLDNYAGEDYDTYVCIMPEYNNNEWHEIHSSSSLEYAVEQNGTTGPEFSSPSSWIDFRGCLSNTDVIKKIRIDSGGMMTMDNTAYVDDINLNGEVIPIEVPEPATIALLSLGGLLLRRRKHS